MFLTEMPTPPSPASLKELVAGLPSALCPLAGVSVDNLVLPENVACFQRSRAQELNLPNQGRTLHHRFVLLVALEGAVTVCVDDRELALHAGEGLLIFPFQFHHYLQPYHDTIRWLIITFEHAQPAALESLRFRPFAITAPLRDMFRELLLVYAQPTDARLVVLLLMVVLTRLRTMRRVRRRGTEAPSMVTQVNMLAANSPEHLVVKQIARKLGISQSHLRTRFAASCGVSLGRHLRRLRLEKACGMLRLGNSRVSEVAESCNFNSIFSFSRAFQTAYGVSPLAYRKAAQPKRATRRPQRKR